MYMKVKSPVIEFEFLITDSDITPDCATNETMMSRKASVKRKLETAGLRSMMAYFRD